MLALDDRFSALSALDLPWLRSSFFSLAVDVQDCHDFLCGGCCRRVHSVGWCPCRSASGYRICECEPCESGSAGRLWLSGRDAGSDLERLVGWLRSTPVGLATISRTIGSTMHSTLGLRRIQLHSQSPCATGSADLSLASMKVHGFAEDRVLVQRSVQLAIHAGRDDDAFDCRANVIHQCRPRLVDLGEQPRCGEKDPTLGRRAE